MKESPLKKMYLQLGAGGTSHNGLVTEIGVQAVFKKNWSARVSYNKINLNPKSLPPDYESGYVVILIFPIYDEYPSIDMNTISFTAGKCFQASRRVSFTTEAGISIINGETATFRSQPVIHDVFSSTSNYSYTKEKKTAIGGMLRADFNWAFLPYVGLGIGTFASFSSIQSPIGFELKLNCGWMNIKPKAKKNK
jgi:opacity protein-like surface antigen